MILIKCFDKINEYFIVEIFHNNECVKLKSKTNIITYCPEECGIYKIKYDNQLIIILYKCDDIIINLCSNNKKVIILTDLNYKGLKIEKGEIILNVI